MASSHSCVYTKVVYCLDRAEGARPVASGPEGSGPGYHDEPLKGELKGLRSIRLSKGYRAYYKMMKDAVELVRVEGVDKHVY